MTRTPSIQRGSVLNTGPPGSVVKLSASNFLTTGETHTRSVVWWGWHRAPQTVSLTATPVWGGIMGFCIVNTGDTVPDPIANPNDPRWLEWFPLTPDYEPPPVVWYDSGVPATRELSLPTSVVELKTQRTIPAGGAALWWSWNIGSTPASTDRVSLAWMTVSLLP